MNNAHGTICDLLGNQMSRGSPAHRPMLGVLLGVNQMYVVVFLRSVFLLGDGFLTEGDSYALNSVCWPPVGP